MNSPKFWPSAFYFAYFSAGGSITGYLIVHYQKNELSLQQIGVLAALPTIMYLLANPIWAAVADIFHLHKRLLPLTMLLTLPFIALISQVHSFWLLCVVVVLFAFCLSPVISLADFAVISMLGEKSYEYGRVRIWGAVGFGISAWGTGLLIQSFGTMMMFITFIIFMSLGVFIATRLPEPRLTRTESYWKGIRTLVSDSRWYGFLLGLFLVGMSFSAINNFFILFLKSQGGSEGLYGLSVAVASISELPVFFFSAYMLRKWSAGSMLILAAAVLFVRLLLISFMVDPRMALLVQLMHGLSFSLMWSAGVSFANEIAPPGMGASAQALFSATQFGLGSGLGALLGSQIYAAYGAVALFQAASAAALISTICLIVIARRRKTLPTAAY